MTERWTDDQLRKLYALLVAESWKDGDDFEFFQEAWKRCARAFGVEGIDNNGYGTVRRLRVAE